jgi:hypothetical protein
MHTLLHVNIPMTVNNFKYNWNVKANNIKGIDDMKGRGQNMYDSRYEGLRSIVEHGRMVPP